MHESITIAEVGDIVKVSGSRMATPFAPPRPGRTPISTPRVMPTNIRPMFIGVRTTAKPCSREFSSTIRASSGEAGDQLDGGEGHGQSVAQERQRIEGSLVERHLEPDLEHEEERDADED